MTRYITKTIFVILLLMLGEFGATQAQMDGDTLLKVKIPIEFVVRDKTYPAGDYTIKPMDAVGAQYLLELTGPGAGTSIFKTFGTTNETPKNTELVFEKVGEKYFLSQIFVKGDTNGNEIERSRTEKDLFAGGEPTEVYGVNEVPAIARKKKGS